MTTKQTSLMPLLLSIIFLSTIHPTTTLPSLPQSWAAHKRALLQLQSDVASGGGNTTTVGLKMPTAGDTDDDDEAEATVVTKPPTPSLDNLITTMSPKPTEQQAEQILKLLLANLDHGDVRSIALKLLPEYTKFCLTTLDCEELHSALRRLYLMRYSELQLALHRMDKLGLLLRRVQYLVEQGTLDAAGSIKLPPPHHHGNSDNHHDRRKMKAQPTLKRKPNGHLSRAA